MILWSHTEHKDNSSNITYHKENNKKTTDHNEQNINWVAEGQITNHTETISNSTDHKEDMKILEHNQQSTNWLADVLIEITRKILAISHIKRKIKVQSKVPGNCLPPPPTPTPTMYRENNIIISDQIHIYVIYTTQVQVRLPHSNSWDSDTSLACWKAYFRTTLF